MSRPRPALGTPFGADGPWLAAILDVLNDLHDLIDDRLPKADASGEPVRVQEPAPEEKPAQVRPIQEPAPNGPPMVDEEPDDEDEGSGLVEVAEPAPADEATARDWPSPPPRSGRGSGLPFWQEFADDAEVPYSPEAGRDDIIAACIRAGVIEAK